MLVAAFPLLQQCFSFFESEKLYGAVTLAPDVKFSVKRWFDGSYQKQKNDYLNDNTGCRSDLVRLNNQVDYWTYNKLHAYGVIEGKDEYLFERFYLEEYNSRDYLRDSLIRSKVIKMKMVQDTFERMGKTFVFTYGGSKAWYFPDKFPEELDIKRSDDSTNYMTFKRFGDSVGLKQVDLNKWLLGMKDTSKHLLFSRLGTHWTVYASALVCDTLIKFLEKERHIRMPHIEWRDVKYSEIPERTDADLDQGLNLITHFKRERFSYPQFYYDSEGQRTKPKVIYIGDSFLWTLFDNKFMQNISSDWELWYYFNEVWTEKSANGGESKKEMATYNWQQALMNTDCVITLYTPANLKGLDYEGAFIEMMYRYFYPNAK